MHLVGAWAGDEQQSQRHQPSHGTKWWSIKAIVPRSRSNQSDCPFFLLSLRQAYKSNSAMKHLVWKWSALIPSIPMAIQRKERSEIIMTIDNVWCVIRGDSVGVKMGTSFPAGVQNLSRLLSRHEWCQGYPKIIIANNKILISLNL